MPEGMRGDLILPPGTYAQVLDSTKGKVNTYVGPYKTSLSETDQLVLWRNGEWVEAQRHEAIQQFIRAAEGQYVILTDPAKEEPSSFPVVATNNDAVDLDHGRKVVIPGPVSFALWPGQTAQPIDGHHLRNNQYLIVRVYEPNAARENAEKAVVETTDGEGKKKERQVAPRDYTMGRQIVIKGTEVSFYIPPTGMEVVPDPTSAEFVRGAVTLQRLEYCILLDESGEKRYVKGPAVVFPDPTEIFQTDETGKRRFQAIELNPQSGLYLKVIADYEDNGTHKAGDERFITGEDQPIYFPRPEESIISYGEERKHHAIAIPSGEGRYVLERTKGSVDLVTGPKMFLPDPRKQVIIRRILDQHLCSIMYPGNQEALAANMAFAEEGIEFANMLEDERLRGIVSPPTGASLYTSVSSLPRDQLAAMNYAASASPSVVPDVALRGARRAAKSVATEDIKRGTTYTPPRTIVLDTKYQGAIRMSVFPGYAVMLVNSTGERRVVLGPQSVLLEYDESPMVLKLSSGKPKNSDTLVETCYLRTINNQVSDRVYVETKDLVPLTIDLSYRVDFEGDPEKWFDLDNYVKVLTDHARSKLRNLAKRHEYQEFYNQAIDIIRDCLLGEADEGPRPGLGFDENGMHLFEVEVLNVKVNNNQIENLTRSATYNALEGAIRLSEAETRTRQEERLQELKRRELDFRDQTAEREFSSLLETLQRGIQQRVEALEGELAVMAKDRELAVHRRKEEADDAAITLQIETNAWKLAEVQMRAEVELFIKRAKGVDETLVQAMNAFGDQRFVESLIEAIGPAAMAMGVSSVDMLHKAFAGTPFEPIMETLSERPFAHAFSLPNGGSE